MFIYRKTDKNKWKQKKKKGKKKKKDLVIKKELLGKSL